MISVYPGKCFDFEKILRRVCNRSHSIFLPRTLLIFSLAGTMKGVGSISDDLV